MHILTTYVISTPSQRLPVKEVSTERAELPLLMLVYPQPLWSSNHLPPLRVHHFHSH